MHKLDVVNAWVNTFPSNSVNCQQPYTLVNAVLKVNAALKIQRCPRNKKFVLLLAHVRETAPTLAQ